MPNFLWSGKSPSGQEEAVRVGAETPEEARKILENRGWTDLRQHTTEVEDFARAQAQAASDPAYQLDHSPKEDLAYHQGTAPGFWSNWLKGVRQSITFILLIGGVLAFGIYRHRTVDIVICSILLGGWLLLFPALHFWFSKTMNLFQKLHTARNWRRWNEVLQLLDELRSAQKSRKIGIGEAEMARYRALALAGLGKVDEAINGFREAKDKTKMPAWLFHSFLATIHTVTKQYEQGLECYRAALQEATDKSPVCIDMGNYLVQRFNCPGEARQLLAQVEGMQLSELARAHLPTLRCGIAFRERDFAAVEKHAREALAAFQKHAVNREYIFEPSILIAQGFLAVGCAGVGKKEEARKYFGQSEKYLATVCLDDLIKEYRALMG